MTLFQAGLFITRFRPFFFPFFLFSSLMGLKLHNLDYLHDNGCGTARLTGSAFCRGRRGDSQVLRGIARR
jgi:hypothetical protein